MRRAGLSKVIGLMLTGGSLNLDFNYADIKVISLGEAESHHYCVEMDNLPCHCFSLTIGSSITSWSVNQMTLQFVWLLVYLVIKSSGDCHEENQPRQEQLSSRYSAAPTSKPDRHRSYHHPTLAYITRLLRSLSCHQMPHTTPSPPCHQDSLIPRNPPHSALINPTSLYYPLSHHLKITPPSLRRLRPAVQVEKLC